MASISNQLRIFATHAIAAGRQGTRHRWPAVVGVPLDDVGRATTHLEISSSEVGTLSRPPQIVNHPDHRERAVEAGRALTEGQKWMQPAVLG